ncbi:MAG: amidohydrolase [Chloroflexi bacterium HGW-Chloroflexi-3]|nr:MAG: amidohydrolase [Chloroflexi bacterium HGW-Chloroflexi-3]
MKNKFDIIIKNAKIVDANTHLLSDDSVIIVDKGVIQKIGNKELLETSDATRIWDAESKLILPGFINTHCHLFQTFMRGLGKDLTFIKWMNNSVRLMMPNLDEEAIYLAAMVGCMESIKSGNTTLVDFMYAHVKPHYADYVLKAFDDCGIRGVLARGMTDVDRLPGSPVKPASYATAADSLAEVDRSRAMYKDHPRINFALAPSVIWGMTTDGLIEIAAYAGKNDMVVTMHILETVDDDQFSLEKYGKTTMRALEDVGILDTDFLGVHAIRVSEDDLSLFKKYRTRISYNPLANMILGSGVAPIVEFTKHEIKVSLGTDGAASNDSQNLIEVMKAGALLQKVHNHDSAALSAWEIFSMATDQGAECINMQDQIGAVSEGKKADLIAIDFKKSNTTPCYDPIASLVYSGNSENISMVMVEGEMIFDQGSFTRFNESEILRKAQQKAKEIYQSSMG